MSDEKIMVYVAARFEDRPRAKAIAAELTADGVVVTSTWLDDEGPEASGHGSRRQWAETDLSDVAIADALVLYNPPEAMGVGKGGRHVETGYALAMLKPVVVIGLKENIFHSLDTVYQAMSASDALKLIRLALPKAQERLWLKASA